MITLFNGHSLTVKTYFAAEAAGLQLSERQSTASLTLSNDAPALNVDDWVRFEDGPGAGIVWRVKTIDDAVEKQTRTVTLEHLIMALKDRIMFGTVKPQDITAKQSTVTAKAAMEYILKQSPDWTLGSFASAYSTVKNPYSFNSDDLYSAMETVSSSLEDCLWEYNFTAYPFKINIRKLSDDVGSEMRTDRNIRTLKKTIDRSRMYTRIYPIGKNNLHIDNDYLSKNENTYGIISHTETDNAQDTKDKLKAWAQERLNRHCVPSVTVSISGMDLHEATGEALDSFTIGKKCRVPLPEYGTTITERVTKLSYRDIIADPTDVTITLANEIVDVATILRETSSGRGARNQAKNDEEDHAWIVDTTDKVALVAEAVAGKDKDGDPNWSRVSELTVDGNGIDGRVTYTEGEVVKHESRITQTEKDITAEVKARKDEDKTLSGKIQVNSDKVGMVVEVKDKKNVIKAASIVTAINDAGESEARISSDKVYIGQQKSTTVINGKCSLSDVSASYISGKIATLSKLYCPEFEGKIYGSSVNIATGTTPYGTTTYSNVNTAFCNMQLTFDEDTDLYTLQYKAFKDSEWQDIGTFERAASTDTTLSGGWSGTTYKVTATPPALNTEQTTVYLQVEVGGFSVAPNDKINAKIYKDNPQVAGNALTTQGMTLTENTSAKIVQLVMDDTELVKGEISTQATYDAGVGSVKLSGSWSGTTYTVSKGTSGGNSASSTVYLQVEVGGYSVAANEKVNAKIYKDDPTKPANQLTSQGMTLTENTSAKLVQLVMDDTQLVKGEISTQNTWQAGWNAVRLNGTWNGQTYNVTKSSSGSTSLATSVYLQIEVGGTSVAPNTKINANIYKDSVSSANLLVTRVMTLSEDVSNKKVLLTTNAGAITKGEISTQATYDAGWSAVRLSGSWDGTTYTVRKASSGGSTASSSVYLQIEVGGTSVAPNTKVNAKIYKDSITPTNQIANTVMTLTEDVANKRVLLTTGSGSSAITKGEISTQDTWQAGYNAAYPQTKTLTCTGATFTQSQWKYTFEYYNSSSGMFVSGRNYKFHNNSGYT